MTGIFLPQPPSFASSPCFLKKGVFNPDLVSPHRCDREIATAPEITQNPTNTETSSN
jgi:hypothetical protein